MKLNLNVRNISAFKPFFRLMKLITKANNFLKEITKINNQKSRMKSKNHEPRQGWRNFDGNSSGYLKRVLNVFYSGLCRVFSGDEKRIE